RGRSDAAAPAAAGRRTAIAPRRRARAALASDPSPDCVRRDACAARSRRDRRPCARVARQHAVSPRIRAVRAHPRPRGASAGRRERGRQTVCVALWARRLWPSRSQFHQRSRRDVRPRGRAAAMEGVDVGRLGSRTRSARAAAVDRRRRGVGVHGDGPTQHRQRHRRDRSPARRGIRRRPDRRAPRSDRPCRARPAAGRCDDRRGLSRSADGMADGAIRSRAASRRAGAVGSTVVDDVRCGGPMKRHPCSPKGLRYMILLVLLSGCARQQPPDAYGNVEATEVVVGAEAAGRLVAFTATEGQTLTVNAVVGSVDSTELALQREQADAQRTATASRIDELHQQIAALEAQRSAAIAERDAATAQRAALVSQHEIAKRSFDRTTRLIAEQAATSQQLDLAERDYRVLTDQIKAQGDQIRTVRAQEQTIRAQVKSADAQVSQIAERIRKSEVRNPTNGTVLTTYAKAGEMVQIGQPLYRIADLSSVDVRAYVTEPHLSSVRIGQDATVSVDAGNGQRQTMAGKVTWISPKAEFTPTPIQTREERADLVYAIKIRTPNTNGLLKIGMPVDVHF